MEIFLGYLTIALPLGAMVGCVLAKAVRSRLGRRESLIMADLLAILGVLLFIQQQTASVFLLVVGRLLLGVSLGVSSVVVPTYIKEVATPELRGLLGSLVSILMSTGILYSFSMNLLLDLKNVYTNSVRHNHFVFSLIISASLFNLVLRLLAILLVYTQDTP